MTQMQYFDDEAYASETSSGSDFHANGADMTSWSAMFAGLLTLFMCLSCGYGMYCLPILPLILGALGLLSARNAEVESRAKLWSWIGLGSGLVVVLLSLLAIFGSIVLAVLTVIYIDRQVGY